MSTHTPATAFAALLNELLILSQDADRSAASWRAEIQKLISAARPASNLFVEREQRAHNRVQDQSDFECQFIETGQATGYIFEDGAFREITVERNNGGPLSDEEVAIMMREGWREGIDGS